MLLNRGRKSPFISLSLCVLIFLSSTSALAMRGGHSRGGGRSGFHGGGLGGGHGGHHGGHGGHRHAGHPFPRIARVSAPPAQKPHTSACAETSGVVVKQRLYRVLRLLQATHKSLPKNYLRILTLNSEAPPAANLTVGHRFPGDFLSK